MRLCTKVNEIVAVGVILSTVVVNECSEETTEWNRICLNRSWSTT